MIIELIICALSFSVFLLIDKLNTFLAFILCTILVYIFLRLKRLHYLYFPSFSLIINQQNICFASLSHGLSYFNESSESISCFSHRFKRSCNGMIIEVILWFSSFLLFLLIEKYFSLLVAFIIYLLIVNFYVRLRATFHNFISSIFQNLYQKITSYRLFRISFGLAYNFKIYKRTYYFLGQLFCFQKSSIPVSIENQNFQNCGDVLIIESEINVLVQNISQHYIQSWYNKLSDNDEFIHLLNKSIKDILHRLCSRVLKIEKKKFSYTILQIYLHFFSHFVEAKKSESFSWDNVQMRHWSMRDTATERCYLQSLISALLDKFGPYEAENSLHSKYSSLLHTIVVEILTETLIQPLIKVLSDPSRINLLILRILLNKINSTETLTVAKLESNSTNKSQPTIILPTEDVSTVSKPNIAKTIASQSRLTVPASSNCNKKAPIINKNPGQELSVESSSFPSLAANLKSSSHSYCSNYDICKVTDLEYDDSASDICDNTFIKRSKSADYIRQMPQLRALNEKDYDVKLQRENNKILVVFKSDSNSNCSVEQAEEAVELEVPTLFTDIKITDTIQQNEDGIVPYTLYCIEYVGIFHDTRYASGCPQFVTQNVSIKRRFSEFVALQSRLEENQVLKIFIKGIKGPSKWLTLPSFSNLDKRYIAERKVFLENYLKLLCDIAPIAQSSELQEFLAYGGDARISFVRRAGDISVPRIDKFLVRGVRGAIDMFKTALPSSGLEIEGLLPVKTPVDETSSDQRFNEYLLDFSYREPEIKEHVNNFFQNSVGNQSFEDLSHKGKEFDSKGKKSSLLRNLSNFKIEECCSCSGLHDNYQENKNLFGNTIIELLDVAIDFNAKKLGDLRTKLVLLLSPLIDRYMVSKIECISDEHLAYALHSLHLYLWPEEANVTTGNTGQNNNANIEKIAECLEDLFSSNYLLHNGVYSVKSTFLEKMKLFILSLQDEKLNKCLLFHMFDIIVEYVCSEE